MTTDLTPEVLDELERYCPAGHYICKATGATLDIPMPALIAAARKSDCGGEADAVCRIAGEESEECYECFKARTYDSVRQGLRIKERIAEERDEAVAWCDTMLDICREPVDCQAGLLADIVGDLQAFLDRIDNESKVNP